MTMTKLTKNNLKPNQRANDNNDVTNKQRTSVFLHSDIVITRWRVDKKRLQMIPFSYRVQKAANSKHKINHNFFSYLQTELNSQDITHITDT